MELCKKKEKNCLSTGFKNQEVGDNYTYIAYKRETDFFTHFHVGKWNEMTCGEFYEKLSTRLRFPTKKRRLTLYTDGNKQNVPAIKKTFPQGTVNYGIRKKIKNNKGEIIGIVSKRVFGAINKNDVHITTIDGFCSKLRERFSCFTRKARSFAKKRKGLENRLEIFLTQHNYLETKKGKTPAMREEIFDRKLNWKEILHTRITTPN